MDLFSRMPHFAKFGEINFLESGVFYDIFMGLIVKILTFLEP